MAAHYIRAALTEEEASSPALGSMVKHFILASSGPKGTKKDCQDVRVQILFYVYLAQVHKFTGANIIFNMYYLKNFAMQQMDDLMKFPTTKYKRNLS